MRLILIRHAERENLPCVADNAQVLTATGQKNARLVGAYLAKLNLPSDVTIFSSDYARALQTAQLIDYELEQKHPIQTCPCLRPESEGSVPKILDLIFRHSHLSYLILVGHQPELEQLGAYLSGRHLTFKRGEAICLQITDQTNWLGKVEWRYLPV